MADIDKTRPEPGGAAAPPADEALPGNPAAEFDRRVDLAVQARFDSMLPELIAKIAAAQLPAAAAEGEGKNFTQSLALQLAELTGQGTGRVYVAPEVVASRRQAMGELTDLLLALHRRGEVPAYKLVNKVFLNLGQTGEQIIEPLFRDTDRVVKPVEIDWPGVPSLSMAPLNEAATRVFQLFCAAIGHQARSEAPDEFFALTSHGAVVRGGAARVILQNDRPREPGETGDPSNPTAALPTAAIRRHGAPPTEKVQVFGTLTRPVEVS